ncbi:hypothetical protein LINPERHAP1_LOCUS34786 [Linum perenne]
MRRKEAMVFLFRRPRLSELL